jgi:tRNA1(Val) A37 N6-methylase TrmN6
MAVVSFFGLIGIGFIAGGAQFPPMHAGGAAAGITIGCGAGIAPVFISAHTTPAAARAISMNPRIPNFLTIP